MVIFGTKTKDGAHFVLFFLALRRPKRPKKLPKQFGGQFRQFAGNVYTPKKDLFLECVVIKAHLSKEGCGL